MGKFIDVTGQRFGRLTVIERAPDHVTAGGHKHVVWKCQCDCGNITYVQSGSLRRGEIVSCGCYLKEIVKVINKKYNRFERHEDYVIGYTSKGEPFIVDSEDYEKIKDICWSKNNYGYLCGWLNGKHVPLARFLLNPPDGMVVDHKNHRLEDNRRCNLRVVSVSENAMNEVRRSDNTSGAKGVSWKKAYRKWTTNINVDGKQIFLGNYDRRRDAIRARKTAEDKLHGQFSYPNSMALAEQNGYANLAQ